MKRALSLLLTLCLILGCVSTALAASITITQQPETQTVKAGGKVTFTVKAKNATGAPVTWYFTNPATGETTTGKQLSKVVKGVKVSNPNGLSITLKKVPESMHGWSLYARLGPKSSSITTDTVQILIEGMDTSSGSAPATGTDVASSTDAAPTEAPASTTDVSAATETDSEPVATAEPAPASSTDAEPETATGTDVSEPEVSEPVVTPEPIVETVYATPEIIYATPEIVYVTPEPTPEPGPIVITGSSKLELYRVDRNGTISSTPEEELTFEAGTEAGFYAKLAEGTEGTIQYLTVDGIRITPDGEVTGISIRGLDHSATVKVKVNKPGQTTSFAMEEEEEPVDESSLVTVTCTNCRFTGYKSSFAETGKVPVGTTITVIAAGGTLSKGYSINGGASEYKNQATFQLTINGDTTIAMESQTGIGTGSFLDDENIDNSEMEETYDDEEADG